MAGTQIIVPVVTVLQLTTAPVVTVSWLTTVTVPVVDNCASATMT